MTACNIWLQPEAGHLISDGAMYDHDGTVRAIRSKMIVNERLRLAIMTLGRARTSDIVGPLREANPQTIADVVMIIPTLVRRARQVVRDFAPEDEASGANEMILAMVFWDYAADRPTAFVMDTGSRQALTAPYALADVVGLSTPTVPLPHPLNSGLLNPETHGVTVLERQRALIDPNFGGDGGASVVGGFVEAVTVTADGLNRRVLHTWPDVVGEPITV